MQVVHVDTVLDRLESEVVGGAMDMTAFDAAAGQPGREAIVVVIPTVDLAGVGSGLGQFDGGRATELAAT